MPDWDMLTPFDFFAEISPESKDTLWRNSKVEKFEKGQQLLQKGSRISGAYLLLEGRLRIYSIGGNGTEGTLYHLARMFHENFRESGNKYMMTGTYLQ